MALATLSIDIVAELAKLREDMGKASRIGDQFANDMRDKLDGLKQLAGNFALGLAAGMTAAFSVGAIREWIAANTEAADELHRLTQQTGVSVETLSAWGNIAKRNGQDVSDLSELIQELSLKLTETDKSTEGAGLALKQLGLNYKDLGKMGAEEAFTKVAQAVSGVEDSGKKTAMVMAILGDEGQKYISTLNAIGSASELEATITTQQAAAAARYKDSLGALTLAGDAWSHAIVGGITPALDEAVRALTDVIKGTGGLTAETRQLAQDGTLADWARKGVAALTYLADAGSVVSRAFRIVGQTAGADLAMAGESISALGDAAKRAISGDMSGALSALSGGMDRVKSISADADKTLSDLWSEETLGSQIRKRMDEIREAGDATKEAGDQAKKSAKNFTLVAQNDDESKKLIQGIRDKIAAMRLEQSMGAQLTSAEQERLTTMRQIADGRTKLNATQRAGVQGALDELVAVEALTAAQREIIKLRDANRSAQAEVDGVQALTTAQQAALQWMERLRDGRIKLSEEQRRSVAAQWSEVLASEQVLETQKRTAAWLDETRGQNADLIEQTRGRAAALLEQADAERQQLAEVGLSAKALQELRGARELDKAAALDSRAAAMSGLDSHAELTEEWRKQADAIRDVVAAQRARDAAEREQKENPVLGFTKALDEYRDKLRATGDAVQESFGSVATGIEDALTGAFNGSADGAKQLFATIKAEALKLLVIRPMMQQLFGATGGSGGGSPWGALVGAIGASFGGYGSTATGGDYSSAGLAAAFGGNRAVGGPVAPGTLYEVNERGPELLTVGDKTMLMMGSDGGRVTPLSSSPAGRSAQSGPVAVTYAPTIHIDSRSDRAAILADVSKMQQQGHASLIQSLRERGVMA